MIRKDHRYVIIGVTHFGLRCHDISDPKDQRPGLYVRVQDFVQWINETIGSDEDDKN